MKVVEEVSFMQSEKITHIRRTHVKLVLMALLGILSSIAVSNNEASAQVPTGNNAALISPSNGSNLSSSSVTFEWTDVGKMTSLRVGSSVGGYEYFSKTQRGSTSVTATGLPTDGSTIHVTLSTWNSGWKREFYEFNVLGNQSLPDLTISDASVSCSSGQIAISATVSNIGTAASPSTSVWFSQDGYLQVGALQPGETVTRQSSVATDDIEPSFAAFIDYRDRISESDETNNTFYLNQAGANPTLVPCAVPALDQFTNSYNLSYELPGSPPQDNGFGSDSTEFSDVTYNHKYGKIMLVEDEGGIYSYWTYEERLDTDGDGVPDSTEVNSYQTDPYDAGSFIDSDGDGASDYIETYFDATDPADGNDFFDANADGSYEYLPIYPMIPVVDDSEQDPQRFTMDFAGDDDLEGVAWLFEHTYAILNEATGIIYIVDFGWANYDGMVITEQTLNPRTNQPILIHTINTGIAAQQNGAFGAEGVAFKFGSATSRADIQNAIFYVVDELNASGNDNNKTLFEIDMNGQTGNRATFVDSDDGLPNLSGVYYGASNGHTYVMGRSNPQKIVELGALTWTNGNLFVDGAQVPGNVIDIAAPGFPSISLQTEADYYWKPEGIAFDGNQQNFVVIAEGNGSQTVFSRFTAE